MVKIKVAVAQTCSQQFDVERTIDKLEQLVSDATSQGAKFVVFPEAFVGGYPKSSTFGTQVGNRDASGREEFLRYHRGAIEVPSATTDRIAKIARDADTSLVVGVIERAGATLYCTALYFDAERGYVAKHRKLMPTGAERLIWGFGDATTIEAQDLSIATADASRTSVKCSATICWENYMPLLRYHTYRQGVQLYCAPTVDARESWIPTVRHIATEGRCFVLSACQFARRRDFPAAHLDAMEAAGGEGDDAVVIAGGSCIVGPMGDVLAGPLRDAEGVLVYEVDLDDVVRGRMDLDVTGHYSRSDLFQLEVKA